MQKRSVRKRYVLGLALVAVFMSSSNGLLLYFLNLQNDLSSVINIAGRQRMLSQRIALLHTKRLVEIEAKEQEKLERKLRAALSLFESSHQDLSQGKLTQESGMDPELEQLYFRGTNSLDNMVHSYVDQVRSWPLSFDAGRTLDADQIDLLLNKLNMAVSLYEKQSQQQTKVLIQIEALIWVLGLITLVLVALLIFYPMEKQLAREVWENQERQKRITDQNRSLEFLNRDLRESMDRSEVATKSKSVFLSNISHELKTPLHTIIGISEMCLEEAEYLHEDIKSVLDAALDLDEKITDILLVTEIESTECIQNKDYRAYPLIESISERLEKLFQRQKNSLRIYNSVPDIPIQLDAARLKLLLRQLITQVNNTCHEETMDIHFALEPSEDVKERELLVEIYTSRPIFTEPLHIENEAENSLVHANSPWDFSYSLLRKVVSDMNGTTSTERIGKGVWLRIRLPLKLVRQVA